MICAGFAAYDVRLRENAVLAVALAIFAVRCSSPCFGLPIPVWPGEGCAAVGGPRMDLIANLATGFAVALTPANSASAFSKPRLAGIRATEKP